MMVVDKVVEYAYLVILRLDLHVFRVGLFTCDVNQTTKLTTARQRQRR